MQTSKLRAALVGGLLVAAAVPLAAAPASATPHAVRVVVPASDSAGASYAGGTATPRISGDGLWLAFDRPGGGAYRKSLVSGATELVSLNDAEQPANAPAKVVGVTDFGTYVAFETAATNMAEGPATGLDLYLRDVRGGHTFRVNRTNADVPVAVKPGESVLADDGDTLVFTSTGNHVFQRYWYGGLTKQVDVSSAGVPAVGGSKDPAVSGDGRYVTFTSSGSNLVASDTNFAPDVFRYDNISATTTRVSVTGNGLQLNSTSGGSAISDDGRYVAFASDATNAVAADTNNTSDVFRRDTISGTTVRASVAAGSKQANGESTAPDISGDGQVVVFASTADDLDGAGKNGLTDVFVRNLTSATTAQLALVSPTSPSGATEPMVSADGRATAYRSAGSFLSHPDHNQQPDVFVEGADPIGPHTGHGELATALISAFDGVDAFPQYATQQAVANGKVPVARLVTRLAHAPAWGAHREPVTRLYEAFFHRMPDPGGLAHWVAKHEQGTKLGRIAAAFAGSSEFTTTYGKLSNADFVALVYDNVLQRSADAAGLAHWVGKMGDGLSRGDVMVQFSESSEGKRTLAPEVDATLVGLGLFGALPPKALYAQAVAAAHLRGEAEWVARTYLLSPEYESHVEK